jgi:hypothetical protein
LPRRRHAHAGGDIGDGPTYLFKLKIPARPKRYSFEGDWQKPDGVEGAARGVGMEIKVAM